MRSSTGSGRGARTRPARTVSRSASKALSCDQWGLALAFGEGICFDPAATTLIQPPADRFWADPHLLWRDGRYWAFVEEYPYRTAKGIISVLELSEQGDLLSARPVRRKGGDLPI